MGLSAKIEQKQLKRKVKITMWSIAVILVLGAGYYMFGNFSSGNRVGEVFKISKKGVMFKTYEGQLNTGALTMSEEKDGIWEFSVPKSKEKVLKDIDKAMVDGKRVKLYYKQKYMVLPWRGDTDYMVYKVDILDN